MLSNAESMLYPPLSCSAQRQILAAASALPVSQRLRISDESKGTKAGDTNEVTEEAAQDTKEEEVKIRRKKI